MPSANGEFTFAATPNSNWPDRVGTATGELRRASDESLVWRGPLANEVSPVSAVVADDGRFVVTFDNWHTKGHGSQTIVIYDGGGSILHSLPLEQILSVAERVRLPTSISSIHWGGDHRLEGETLILSVQIIPWDVFESEDYDAYRQSAHSPDRSRGITGPVVMLNLLRFRAIADYSAAPGLAPAAPITGEAAYRLYMEHTRPFLEKSGGGVLFHGRGGAFLIGPSEERWDAALLVRQASVAAFLAFASDEAYLSGIGHRTAALEDSRLLPLVAAPA